MLYGLGKCVNATDPDLLGKSQEKIELEALRIHWA
jgi:hypothetical protein